MIIEDSFVITAPPQEAWDFLLDIARVSQCIPGVGKVKQVNDDTYEGNLVVKVGPIGANFAGQVQLEDVEPPHRLSAKARARDQATASMASIDFSADMTPTETGETEVAFMVDVTIRGRLGQFGQGVVRETARQITRVFAECVQAKLESQPFSEQTEAAGDSFSSEAVPQTSSPVTTAKSPSLFVILIKSVINALANWLRSLRPST